MARTPSAASLLSAVLLAASCTPGEADETDVSIPQPITGITLQLLDSEGKPAIGSSTSVGGQHKSQPDASGMVLMRETPLGLLVPSASWEGHAPTYARVDVQVGQLSMVRFQFLPLTTVGVSDPSAPVVLSDAGVTVTAEPGDIELNGAPPVDPYDFQFRVVGEDERRAVPGSDEVLRGDADVRPMHMARTWFVRPWPPADATRDEFEFRLAGELSVAIDAGPGSGFEGDLEGWGLYVFDNSQGFWRFMSPLEADATGTLLEGEAPLMGWTAVGREDVVTGCATAKVTYDGGVPLTGTSVVLLEDGVAGVRRVESLVGELCMQARGPGTATALVMGFEPTRERLMAAAMPMTLDGLGTCGPSDDCASLGDLFLTVYEDADDDGSWGGPGGDCDDDDPSVNPSIAFGDGSWCG